MSNFRSRLSLSLFTMLFLAGNLGSTAFGQRIVPSGVYKMQLYLDQVNRQNAEQKNAIIGEAKTLINQSNTTIQQCESGLSKMSGELTFAGGRVKNSEKALEECSSQLRIARKERADREVRILADQEPQSRYRVVLKELQDAEEASAKHAERILNRPVRDGNPQKLSSTLKKSEFKSLEEDREWVETFRQYSKAKQQLTEELRRIVLIDASITAFDATIQQLNEEQRKLKNEFSKERATHKKLQLQASHYSAMMESAKNDLQSAQLVVARITGR